jgi:DNA (cytosine-5)-methyltransferase 1
LQSAGLAKGRDVWRLRNGNQPNAVERSEAEPAPTVAFGHNAARVEWVYERPAPTIVTTRRSDERKQARDSGPAAEREPRDAEEPSYTIRANGSGSHPSGVRWVEERPATTGQGDPRIFPAGRAERNPDYEPGDDAVSQAGAGGTAVRVTLEEAAVLQSFPPDYPFRGSKTKRFEQVGNAIPPLLALAVLEALEGTS